LLSHERRVSLAKKKFFGSRSKFVWARISKFPDFFFARFFSILLLFSFRLFYGRFRVLLVAISSEAVKDAKNLKIYSETTEFGPTNRQVSLL
jgi:hypothetical protein